MTRTYKMMFLGAVAVGKTSLARRLAFNKFETDYKSTIGVEVYQARYSGSGGELQFALWDTDGEAGERILESVYLKGASGAFIVADLTRQISVEAAERLTLRFVEKMPGRPVFVLLNKSDQLSNISSASTEKLAQEADLVIATSAKTGDGIDDLMAAVAAAFEARQT